MRSILLVALSLVSSSAIAAPPTPGPTFAPDFSPHPYETSVKLQNGEVSMTERFRGCGTSFTTEAPAWTFTLPQQMTDLRVWVDSPAVLVLPNSRFICIQGGVAYYNDWAPGTYQVYLFSPSIGLGANIRVEMPQRARAEADAAIAATPSLTLDPAGPDNPTFHTLTPGPALRPELAGLGCGHPRVVPLARLEVPKAGAWTVTARGRRVTYVVAPDGRCLGRDDNTGALRLEAGRYALWGQLAEGVGDTPWEVELADEARALTFSGPPTHALGALAEPLALRSTLAAPSWGPTRRVVCAGLPRTPSFFLRVTPELGSVALEPLRHPGARPPRMVVVGPLEGMKPYQMWRCDEATRAVLHASGTRAVYLAPSDEEAAGEAGAEVVTVARRLELKPDPMAAPLPIPDAPPLAERVLARSYPYYEKTSVERFFLEAPEQLFIYLTAPEGEVPAHEPLALIAYDAERSTVARFDGQRFEVPTAALTTTRPTPVVLPAKAPKLTPAKDLDEALSLAGPAEKDLVEAYDKAEGVYRGCVQRFMEKNDPTWGKSYELIYVSTGRSVTDVWFRRADAACGYAALEAKGKKLTADINRSRQKSAVAYFKALQARFGK